MNADGIVPPELSKRIIGAAIGVSNGLGVGFLEKVYENALAHELRKSGLAVVQQKPVTVTYDGLIVGEYSVDLLVEQSIVVELKAIRALTEVHRAQCMNYLRATRLELCPLLIPGNPRLDIKRIVPGLCAAAPRSHPRSSAVPFLLAANGTQAAPPCRPGIALGPPS